MTDNPFRSLPSVNEVLARIPGEPLLAAIRAELAAQREALTRGEQPSGSSQTLASELAQRAWQRVHQSIRPKLIPVINATGIVLHTNLGRAPLHPLAAEAARMAASGYLNLEVSLETGKRSSRQDALRDWLCQLTGAEAATAVNNNAAATVLALRALCAGREVVVSRGQLVEIGGSFRIPEIMEASGAILREVGTTNRTRLSDYERAIGPNTAALLRIHPSNYRIRGFTESVGIADLVTLGHSRGVMVMDDIGSGALIDLQSLGFADEPPVRASIDAGADLVWFSGDKLLGGPQAGILIGRKELIARVEKDPLMRAFRLDKMTLAALEATLRLYLDRDLARREIPILQMLSEPLDSLRQRAEQLAYAFNALPTVNARVVADQTFVGGGSLPDQQMPTWVVELSTALSEAELAARLRQGNPAVLSRVRQNHVVLDVRTLLAGQDQLVVQALQAALQRA
ncbi:MAG: L-seryl-tRNA(Sec) selenium transferase [Gemmataceae bacterium]